MKVLSIVSLALIATEDGVSSAQAFVMPLPSRKPQLSVSFRFTYTLCTIFAVKGTHLSVRCCLIADKAPNSQDGHKHERIRNRVSAYNNNSY